MLVISSTFTRVLAERQSGIPAHRLGSGVKSSNPVDDFAPAAGTQQTGGLYGQISIDAAEVEHAL